MAHFVRKIKVANRTSRGLLGRSGAKTVEEAGYSLMEVLIAVAIIAVLAALVAPRLFGQLDSSQVTAARTQLRMIETTLDTFRLDVGRYPTQQEGLQILVSPGADLAGRWNGPYLDGDVPEDPWGRPFQYIARSDLSQRGIVYSLGSDGIEGGDGSAADIRSRSATEELENNAAF